MPVMSERKQWPRAEPTPDPGCIIELADGGPWLKNDLTWTPIWDERGVWSDYAEAESAIAKSLDSPVGCKNPAAINPTTRSRANHSKAQRCTGARAE